MEENPIHNTYTPAAKERLRRYREAHKEKVNEIQKNYYHKRMEEDPEYKQKLRDQAKARYHKKKAEQEAQQKQEEDKVIKINEDKEKIEEETENKITKKNKSTKNNVC